MRGTMPAVDNVIRDSGMPNALDQQSHRLHTVVEIEEAARPCPMKTRLMRSSGGDTFGSRSTAHLSHDFTRAERLRAFTPSKAVRQNRQSTAHTGIWLETQTVARSQRRDGSSPASVPSPVSSAITSGQSGHGLDRLPIVAGDEIAHGSVDRLEFAFDAGRADGDVPCIRAHSLSQARGQGRDLFERLDALAVERLENLLGAIGRLVQLVDGEGGGDSFRSRPSRGL